MIREIVTIDEERCDGCGLCVPSCHEGALRIVNGKARLVADVLCDGLGACLGHCPRGAIRIERRESAAFDERAVAAHQANVAATPLASAPRQAAPHSGPAAGHGGCPGSRQMNFNRPAAAAPAVAGTPQSELGHWPVQLRLLAPNAPVLQGARLLITADCVPVAYGAFQSELLRGRAVVMACPKLDDPRGYVEKLTAIIAGNGLAEIVVARMEVPCCAGLMQMVCAAHNQAGVDVPVREVVIGVRGALVADRTRAPQTSE